jgi:hypothetical protein
MYRTGIYVEELKYLGALSIPNLEAVLSFSSIRNISFKVIVIHRRMAWDIARLTDFQDWPNL